MLRPSQRDIQQGYRGIKYLAKREIKRGHYEKALWYIDKCSTLAAQFNWIYSDDDIEKMLFEISNHSIATQSDHYEADPDKWVLYDDWCTSYVLAIQWLEAMARTGKDILYITSRSLSTANKHTNILGRAESFKNVKIEIICESNSFKRAQKIYDCIVGFKASKVVLHKRPVSSPCNLAIYSLPQEIEMYLINLSDQTFWQGAKAIDYCLEFRQFGASVSIQRRGLTKEQLLLVPFYPADDKNPFLGFPSECTEDKVVIFSGGDYYKTLNGRRTYWRLVKAILDNYPQVVFLFATKNIPEGDSEIHQFIQENHFEGRFLYINFRPDIYQVFAHCDIYMGTSPTSGSLMTGLACVNAKPILQYYEPGTTDDETEQSICYNDNFSISFKDEGSFMEEAGQLIKDISYRKSQGLRMKNAIISQCQFESLVKATLECNMSQLGIEEYRVNYRELKNRWFYLEEAGYTNSVSYIYSLLKSFHCMIYAPGVFLQKNINRILKH